MSNFRPAGLSDEESGSDYDFYDQPKNQYHPPQVNDKKKIENALQEAIINNNTYEVEEIIRNDMKGNVNMSLDSGWTPLMHACFHSQESIVKLLIDKGADPNLGSVNVKCTFASDNNQQGGQRFSTTYAAPPSNICRGFVKGLCSHNKCKYSHELKYEYMRSILRFCRNYQNKVGCSRKGCFYLHTTKDEETLFWTKGVIPRVLLERYASVQAQGTSTQAPSHQPLYMYAYTEQLSLPPPPPPPLPPPPLPPQPRTPQPRTPQPRTTQPRMPQPQPPQPRLPPPPSHPLVPLSLPRELLLSPPPPPVLQLAPAPTPSPVPGHFFMDPRLKAHMTEPMNSTMTQKSVASHTELQQWHPQMPHTINSHNRHIPSMSGSMAAVPMPPKITTVSSQMTSLAYSDVQLQYSVPTTYQLAPDPRLQRPTPQFHFPIPFNPNIPPPTEPFKRPATSEPEAGPSKSMKLNDPTDDRCVEETLKSIFADLEIEMLQKKEKQHRLVYEQKLEEYEMCNTLLKMMLGQNKFQVINELINIQASSTPPLSSSDTSTSIVSSQVTDIDQIISGLITFILSKYNPVQRDPAPNPLPIVSDPLTPLIQNLLQYIVSNDSSQSRTSEFNAPSINRQERLELTPAVPRYPTSSIPFSDVTYRPPATHYQMNPVPLAQPYVNYQTASVQPQSYPRDISSAWYNSAFASPQSSVAAASFVHAPSPSTSAPLPPFFTSQPPASLNQN